MLMRSLLGLAALLVATSCVPERAATPPHRVAAITRGEATLLRRLALTAPDAADPAPAAPMAAVTPLTTAPPFAGTARTLDDAGRAVECLTAAVYYEARSEPVDGQRAVAQVVLNRVRDRAFPGSICGVVYQRSSKGCQFSFACDGSTGHPIDPAAWLRARAVASAAFGGAVYAPVGAATYYHTSAVSPWWAPSLARIGQIDAHIFYGWRRAMADVLTFRRGYAGVEPGALPAMAPALATVAEDVAGGVTIHRGQTAPPAEQLADIATESGVRVHRRSPPPGVAVAASGAAMVTVHRGVRPDPTAAPIDPT